MDSDTLGALAIGAIIAVGYLIHRLRHDESVVTLTEPWKHDGITFHDVVKHSEHDLNDVDGYCYACRYLMERAGVDLTPRPVVVLRFDHPLDELPAEVIGFASIRDADRWAEQWRQDHGQLPPLEITS